MERHWKYVDVCILTQLSSILIASSDCVGNYCNGHSGVDFFNQNSSPPTTPATVRSSDVTCYTCTAISHSGDLSDMEPCLSPSPSTVADMGGCERCMQQFEVQPTPGHLRVRRACSDQHFDTNTVTSHFHFCVEDLCNSLVYSNGAILNTSFIFLLSIFFMWKDEINGTNDKLYLLLYFVILWITVLMESNSRDTELNIIKSQVWKCSEVKCRWQFGQLSKSSNNSQGQIVSIYTFCRISIIRPGGDYIIELSACWVFQLFVILD